MRLATAVSLLLLCLGCSLSQDLDLEVTPTPEVLRVRLGGEPTPDPDEMRSRIRELNGEIADVMEMLLDYGYSVATKDARKTWPWPIQTQVAQLLKDHGRIKADLMRMGEWPTPRPTRRPLSDYYALTPVSWPTIAVPTLPTRRPTFTPTPTYTPIPLHRPLPTPCWRYKEGKLIGPC